MTFVITQTCCKDASCVPVCPVHCIRPLPGDPDFTTAEQLYVDPATCIDCAACLDECPVGAIHSEWDLPQELSDYLEINADHFTEDTVGEAPPPAPQRRKLPDGRTALLVAIVGSGPAACYAAAELSEIKGVNVSIFERLPTPFGLIDTGVAPDHTNTKLIADRFGAVLARPNVHCYFNVDIGHDLTIAELLQHHHAVLWAGGADDDRRLDIPGEDLPGCFAARDFVAWYNGHPAYGGHPFDLTGHRALVIGNGNVALDVARVMARPPDAFVGTDMADHAVEALRHSAIREIVVAARRGPEHAAYTTGELLALERTDGAALLASPEEAPQSDTGRRSTIIAAAARRRPTRDQRTITFRYGLSPEAINGADSVESVTFRRSDGGTETIKASLVLRAIGYRGRAVPDLPFDESTGTLPHRAGSVVDPATGAPVTGVYCAGWIKRGATGMIGSNKTDAQETVDSILRDYAAGQLDEPAATREHLDALTRSFQAVPDRRG
ncbi:NAD(P)-binding protein [Actinomadura sp. LOL_016]|uniref:NAD(P)-binding protein n=1 Tax=unclassified Actinomadura TaxID=2626254 RepID=UPI003A80C9BC